MSTSTLFHLCICRIQEVMDGDLREAGRVPRTMEAELTADLGQFHSIYIRKLNNEHIPCTKDKFRYIYIIRLL